jgi:PAS domain S-box-containing protein
MKMRIPGFKNKETPHALSAQLRKSYIVLCTVIVIFFLIYTVQVVLFNGKATTLNNKLQGDHNELKYNRLLSLQLFIQDVYLKDYLYSNDISYRENVLATFNSVDENLDNLKLSINDEGVSDTLVSEIESFIRYREQGITKLFDENSAGEFGQGDELVRSLTSLNDSIKIRLQKLEQLEDIDITERTNTTSKYNYYRIVSSIISYIIISILLIYSLYKINQNIKRRLMAEEKARINEKKYKALVEDSGMKLLVINNKGYIKFANKNIESLSGHKADEIIGLPVQKSILPRFRKNVKEVIRLLNNTGRYENTIELQIVTKAGAKKWILCKVFPINIDNNRSGEWQVMIWDIDEEKKIQLELELLEEQRMQQQKLIQDIIDNIPSVIFIKDTAGRYILVNKKIHAMLPDLSMKMLGLTDKDLIGEPVRYKAYKYSDDKVMNTGQVSTMEDVVEVNGKKRYLLITKFPLFDDAGNVKNICGLATDITEQKESEIHLMNAKKEAEGAKTAQEAFLANMSHEIRTPMNGIMGMANLLLGAKLSEEQKEYVENIQDSGKNLLSIINDLLDFSKIRSGKFQFDNSPFKLKHAIKKALYPLQIRAEEKLLKMEMHFDENVPDVVIGDPVRLQQIIINLAGNAVKFTSQGLVSVKVTCNKKSNTQAFVRVDVIDTGIGIANEKLDYIFESFTQDNLNTSRTYGGTGLGLAIVRQLVELQDGEVSVESTIGEGSTFSVLIPFAIDANAKVQENKYAAISNETDDLLSGISILVAEDNLINQKVVLNTLKRKGAEVKIVSNGQEAIESIEDGGFDIVLMDLQMPEVDGYKATKYIREVLHNNVPILAMTADAIKGEAEKCFEAGMTGFISKPFDPADLYLQILKSTGNTTNNTYIQDKQSEQMEEPLIDFSFLYEISGNDSKYINDVVEIFLSSTTPGLETLKELVEVGTDWDAIGKQAHFLKSSVSVIKIRGVYDLLANIERNAFSDKDMGRVKVALATIVEIFEKAMPLLNAELERTK